MAKITIKLKGKIKNEEHFKIIFEEYYSAMFHYAYKIIDNQLAADDIAQEVFLDLWKNKKNVEIYAIASYLYKSVKFKCMNYLRHKKIIIEHSDEIKNTTQDFTTDDINLIEEELIREITSLIDLMPEQRKKVFNLHLKGMTQADIADELDVSINTVKSHKLEARKFLKANLKSALFIAFILNNDFF